MEPINRLFLTNNYSIISKYSATKLNYFDDKILERFVEKYLVSKTWRRTSLVNRGYGARLLAMDMIVNRYITTKSVDCFIVLGAGYDTLAFRETEANICFIELDLPQVVEVKSKYIQEERILEEGGGLIQTESARYNSANLRYHLVACDLRDTNGLINILRSILARMAAESCIYPENFAIINEVCLCYLETSEIIRILENLIESVKGTAHKVHYIGYEQVKPDNESQFNSVMLNHFLAMGHPIKHYPTWQQIHEIFINNLNFSQVKIESMYKIFHEDLLILRARHKGYTEEPFDEYEEMDLYLSHYALITGTYDMMMKVGPKTPTSKSDLEFFPRDSIALDRLDNQLKIGLVRSNIQRFGHSSCLISDNNSDSCSILSCGGFGKSQVSSTSTNINQQHKRLYDCFILSTNDDDKSFNTIQLNVDNLAENSISLDRMHGQCCYLSDNLFFFAGGRQGPARVNSTNVTFIARLKENQLTLESKCPFDDSYLRWRHRITKLNDGNILQIGGQTWGYRDCNYRPAILWNLSSDKFGPSGTGIATFDQILARHSFGMDNRNSDTVLLFGGLSTSVDSPSTDSPIDKSDAAALWDFRCNGPIRFPIESARCYGANVNFISEDQFVKIGGISLLNGLASDIEMFDLRQGTKPYLSIPVRGKEEEPMILTNATTWHLKNERKIITLGGGGNFFTFGTHFNKYHLVYQY